MIPVTLIAGATPSKRERAILASINPERQTAVILEGLPDGKSVLDEVAQSSDIWLARIAAGCLCCAGNLVMRVTLNRMLQRAPQHLFISLNDTAHLEHTRAFLSSDSYRNLVSLTEDLTA